MLSWSISVIQRKKMNWQLMVCTYGVILNNAYCQSAMGYAENSSLVAFMRKTLHG